MSQQSGTSLWSVLLSVLASFFGVQSHANYERDFTKGTFISFIVLGVILVALLVTGLMVLVKWLSQG
jgi:hypothetical protein